MCIIDSNVLYSHNEVKRIFDLHERNIWYAHALGLVPIAFRSQEEFPLRYTIVNALFWFWFVVDLGS